MDVGIVEGSNRIVTGAEIEEERRTKSRLEKEIRNLIADFLSKANPIVMDIIYHCIDKIGTFKTDYEEKTKCLNQLNDILTQKINFNTEQLAYINGYFNIYLLFSITSNILNPYYFIQH